MSKLRQGPPLSGDRRRRRDDDAGSARHPRAARGRRGEEGRQDRRAASVAPTRRASSSSRPCSSTSTTRWTSRKKSSSARSWSSSGCATKDHAIQLANDCPYALGSSVFSKDTGRAERLARRIRAGMTVVNDYGLAYMIQFVKNLIAVARALNRGRMVTER
ncbi:MAG: aldehyde dehydrogenase family protein [Polyangiaceae bacterium]|nr:aldehyde dehydrogenase family protein [Polyangiaceae bacterium]